MTPHRTNRANVSDVILAAVLIAGGLAVTGVSLMRLAEDQYRAEAPNMSRREMAQVAQPEQGTPSVTTGKDNGPAESMPGGTRPTTPAPEPARPDADAQKAGVAPALPPAPAEKMGEPIKK
jgi:hypothetical protein